MRLTVDMAATGLIMDNGGQTPTSDVLSALKQPTANARMGPLELQQLAPTGILVSYTTVFCRACAIDAK